MQEIEKLEGEQEYHKAFVEEVLDISSNTDLRMKCKIEEQECYKTKVSFPPFSQACCHQ